MPAGPINTVADVFADPQIAARGMRIDPDGIPGVRTPITMSASALALDTRSPRLDEHRAQILAELAEQQGRRQRPCTIPDIIRVGVIGAGQMGSGIAHVFALAGFEVVLNDISADSLERARTSIAANLDRQVRKATITARPKAGGPGAYRHQPRLCRPRRTATSSSRRRRKTKTPRSRSSRRSPPICAPHAILATNTSSISITRLATASGRPDRFVGLHFMNPVPMMALVELIAGAATSAATFQVMQAIVARLGKVAAVAADSPAFIVNRILIPMLNEAIFTLYEGVGSVEAIDTAMTLGTNQPMGPLLLADFIGLDTCLAIMQRAQQGLCRSQIPPLPAAGEICRGRLARPQKRTRLL